MYCQNIFVMLLFRCILLIFEHCLMHYQNIFIVFLSRSTSCIVEKSLCYYLLIYCLFHLKGILDFLVVKKESGHRLSVKAYRNDFNTDTTFLKITGIILYISLLLNL